MHRRQNRWVPQTKLRFGEEENNDVTLIFKKNATDFFTKERDNLINVAINGSIRHQPNYPIV